MIYKNVAQIKNLKYCFFSHTFKKHFRTSFPTNQNENIQYCFDFVLVTVIADFAPWAKSISNTYPMAKYVPRKTNSAQ